jgi:chorismate mutase
MIRGDAMDTRKEKYYIISSEALPEVFLKVMEVKRLLQEGKTDKINDAVKMVGISRSTYYKYKDTIFDFYDEKSDIITFVLMLDHVSGTLSRILDVIAKSNANILTINQNIPQSNVAMVSISIDTITMEQKVEDLLELIKHLPGVKSLRVVSKH